MTRRRKKTIQVNGEKITIRPCIPEDIANFHKGRGLFKRRAFDEGIEDSVAVWKEECVGHAFCKPDTGELLGIIVHPNFRENGIGKLLISSFSVPIKTVKVIADRDIPRKFYARLGFTPTGETVDLRGTKLLVYEIK